MPRRKKVKILDKWSKNIIFFKLPFNLNPQIQLKSEEMKTHIRKLINSRSLRHCCNWVYCNFIFLILSRTIQWYKFWKGNVIQAGAPQFMSLALHVWSWKFLSDLHPGDWKLLSSPMFLVQNCSLYMKKHTSESNHWISS